jgi:RHS repeat-associated protein
MASSTSDPYLYAGLYQDTEYGGHDAWYRNYSAEQSRWLTPDPYNGSYDLMNPQSFNRYMYVNGNPLGFEDPSGLAGGWATGWGGVCHFSGAIIGQDSNFPFNPCNPISSGISIGVYAAIHGLWSSITVKQIVPVVSAALTIACSIDDFNKSACGPAGWTSAFIGGDAGKVVDDSIAAIGAILCATDPGGPACTGYIIYTIANDLFSVFWDLFGPPQFTGSLLPRPSDLGGLGTAPIGIPNNNFTVKELLGSASHVTIPSPQLNLP